MAERKVKVPEHIEKYRQIHQRLSPSIKVIAAAFIASVFYVAGMYHYQIEAAIGPVFGYRSHSGSIDLNSLQQTYNQLSANFDGKLDTNKLIQGANGGLVAAAGDTYTVYMSPSDSTDYNDSLSGNIGAGIGAEIGLRNGRITIVRILSDNAAEKAGLVANDVVVKVNDQSTNSWSVEKAVGQIKGDEGTTVKLTIQRGDDTKDYIITRSIIKNPSVETNVTDGLGSIVITRFDSETVNLLKTAAQNFNQQSVKAIILDLRDNGGGYVNAATGVAGLWLDNKVVVVERTGSTIRETARTGSNALLQGIPTVVLVNGNTASASEIVAGALHDYHVAKLVGKKTFGKGSVQELIPLNGGAQLKVTIAKWYTPNGINIAKEGIKPDVTVSLTQKDIDGGVDPQFNAAKKLLGL